MSEPRRTFNSTNMAIFFIGMSVLCSLAAMCVMQYIGKPILDLSHSVTAGISGLVGFISGAATIKMIGGSPPDKPSGASLTGQ